MSNVSKTATVSQWRGFGRDLLTSVGMFAAEAELTIDRLVDAEFWKLGSRGFSDIADCVESGLNGDMDVRAQIEWVHETSAIVMINAHQSSGRLAATRAVEKIIDKIPQSGLVAVGIKNSQRFGSPALYAAMLASKGYIAACLTNNGQPALATFAHTQIPFFGTNLASWAYPLSDEQILITTTGTLSSGESSSDFQSLPTENLGVSMSMLTTAMLAGPLVSGKFSIHKTRGVSIEQTQHFLIAFDPEQFGGKSRYQKELQAAWQKLVADSSFPSERFLRSIMPQDPNDSLTIDFTPEQWQILKAQALKAKLNLPPELDH